VFVPVLAGQRSHGARLARADLPVLALLGLLGVSLYFWLQYTGVKLTNAGLSALLVVGLIHWRPCWLPRSWVKSASRHAGRQRWRSSRRGRVVVSQIRLALALESGFLVGALCLVGNALCFAVYTTLVRGFRDRYSPLTLTAATMVVGTLG